MVTNIAQRGVPRGWVWLLATGSREFTNHDLARRALVRVCEELVAAPGRIIVVHGARGTRDRDGNPVKGLDIILDAAARELGMRTEPHEADWDTCGAECRPGHRRARRNGSGSWCPTAGHRRNQKMVDAHSYARCLGFPLGMSVGTRDCMRRAAAAGIRVVNCTEMGLF